MRPGKISCSRPLGRASLPAAVGFAMLLPASGAQAAQVFATDVIVQGSECVGIDCSATEAFGFDTLRLKENNLQINFDDTSTSAGFPANDWRIIANDSASGGASYLAIEDSTAGRQVFRVEAGAPANSLVVSSSGNVGIGTATPGSLELHIVDGDTPTVRLEQDSSAGFAAQTWDVAGNETNFFVRDVTNGSTLPFKIIPGAPNNALYVASSGNVGLGTTSPSAKLQVQSGDLLVSGGNVHVSTGEVLVEQTTAGVSADLAMKGGTGNTWFIRNDGKTGRLTFSADNGAAITSPFKFAPAAVENLFRVGVVNGSTVDVNGTLQVVGALTVNGTGVPDYVFDSGYQLPSIEDHADAMFAERHLPAVPAAPEGGNGQINIVAYQLGMLQELEQAHLYISQLSRQVQELQGDLASRDRKLANLEARLETVEER